MASVGACCNSDYFESFLCSFTENFMITEFFFFFFFFCSKPLERAPPTKKGLVSGGGAPSRHTHAPGIWIIHWALSWTHIHGVRATGQWKIQRHYRDSNPGPIDLESNALTTRPTRPAIQRHYRDCKFAQSHSTIYFFTHKLLQILFWNLLGIFFVFWGKFPEIFKVEHAPVNGWRTKL